jgi:hypothetical protein
LVILAIFTVPYYQNNVAPFNRTIISIDDTKITMKYFLEKARISGSDPMSMLQIITEEELIKIMAPQYGIRVTDADIDAIVRSLAAGDAESISDVEFREWYRQQLNNANITGSQYKEIIRNQMLATRLQQYLAKRVPTVTGQVHLYWIVVETLEEAEEVEKRLDAGESFTELAKEVSLDPATKDSGGELGWFPPEVFTYEEQIAKLDVNQYTSPIAHTADTPSSSSSTETPTIDSFLIFMVSEKDPAREVDKSSLEVLKERSFEDWFNSEIGNHAVKYNFNSEISAWLSDQLGKDKVSSTTTPSGS